MTQYESSLELLSSEPLKGTVGDGALCFVKDYFRRKYFLILFAVHEFKTEPLWEHQINEKMTENMTFKQTFIQFDGVKGRVSYRIVHIYGYSPGGRA